MARCAPLCMTPARSIPPCAICENQFSRRHARSLCLSQHFKLVALRGDFATHAVVLQM